MSYRYYTPIQAPVYNPFEYDINRHKTYAHYVDHLREQFTIRIEVKGKFVPDTRYQLLKDIELYLNRLEKDNYTMQAHTGYVGLHYVWFMHKEDALAFMLKFNGKVV
jgi:hypothetical protein